MKRITRWQLLHLCLVGRSDLLVYEGEVTYTGKYVSERHFPKISVETPSQGCMLLPYCSNCSMTSAFSGYVSHNPIYEIL